MPLPGRPTDRQRGQRGAGVTVSESALEARAPPAGWPPGWGRRRAAAAAAGVGATAGAPPLPLVAGRAGPRWRTLRRLSRHRSGMLGLAGLLLIALVALVGPRFLPYDPTAVDVLQKLQPPSAAHWLGTDYLGRDLLSRTVDGRTARWGRRWRWWGW